MGMAFSPVLGGTGGGLVTAATGSTGKAVTALLLILMPGIDDGGESAGARCPWTGACSWGLAGNETALEDLA